MKELNEFLQQVEMVKAEAKTGDVVRVAGWGGVAWAILTGTATAPLGILALLLAGAALLWQILGESQSTGHPPRWLPSMRGYGWEFLLDNFGQNPRFEALSWLFLEFGESVITQYLESLAEGDRERALSLLIDERREMQYRLDEADDDTEFERLRQDGLEGFRKILRLTEAPQAAPTSPEPPPAKSDAISPPAESAQWNSQQWALWRQLMGACPELRFLLLANVVVVSGPQQTGKSSLAAAIAYLRQCLLQWRSVAVSPHPDGRSIFPGDVVGTDGDFGAIGQFYQDFRADFAMGRSPQTLVVDELTQYHGKFKALGQSLVRTAISESVKHGWRPILINHASTLAGGFAGIEGVRSLLDSSVVSVMRRYAYNPDGSVGISPVVLVTLPDLGEKEIVIPGWVHLPYLRQAFPCDVTRANPEGTRVTGGRVTAPVNAWIEVSGTDDYGDTLSLPQLPQGPVSTPTLTPDGLRMMGWLKRQAIRFNTFEYSVRELQRGRPLGRNIIAAKELQPAISELLLVGVLQVVERDPLRLRFVELSPVSHASHGGAGGGKVA